MRRRRTTRARIGGRPKCSATSWSATRWKYVLPPDGRSSGSTPKAGAEDYYPGLFSEASQRIAAAADWFAGKGERVLASHSLGSWMSQHYLESAKRPPFTAWICMGRGGALPKLPLPVLDVYGEKDNAGVLASAGARQASRQVRIAGADHFYSGKEDALARVLREFIDGL